MERIEYSRFNWVDVTVSVVTPTHNTEHKRVEIEYVDGAARIRTITDGAELDTLTVAPDDDGIRRVIQVDRDHYDLLGDDGTVWQIYRGGCGCG